MALINFPNTPVVGQTYTFLPGEDGEKIFRFMAGETGASDGYWVDASFLLKKLTTTQTYQGGAVPCRNPLAKIAAYEFIAVGNYLRCVTNANLTGIITGPIVDYIIHAEIKDVTTGVVKSIGPSQVVTVEPKSEPWSGLGSYDCRVSDVAAVDGNTYELSLWGYTHISGVGNGPAPNLYTDRHLFSIQMWYI